MDDGKTRRRGMNEIRPHRRSDPILSPRELTWLSVRAGEADPSPGEIADASAILRATRGTGPLTTAERF